MVIGRSTVKHLSSNALQSSRHATVEPKWEDIGGQVSTLAGADVLEARQLGRSNSIVVADNHSRTVESLQRPRDSRQLATIEKLSVGEVHVREGHSVNAHDLRDSWRHSARHFRNR